MQYSPLYSPLPFAGILIPLVAVALLWTIVLKGFALWYAAKGGQKWWFIALLILNTLGILEIIYLIWFRTDVAEKSAPIVHSSSAHHG